MALIDDVNSWLDTGLTGLSRIAQIEAATSEALYKREANRDALATARAESKAKTAIAEINAKAAVDQARAAAADRLFDFGAARDTLVNLPGSSQLGLLVVAGLVGVLVVSRMAK